MAKRSELMAVATELNLSEQVLKMLQTVNGASTDHFLLASGRSVRRTSTGMQAIRPSHDTRLLSNVVIDVEERIVTSDGIDYVCNLKTASAPHIITKRICDKDLNNIITLQQIIERAFVNAGVSVYVAMDEFEGYRWRDILAKMAEGKRVSKELQSLGVDSELQVHFPNFILNVVDKRICDQSRALPFIDNVRLAYAGLRRTATIESKQIMRQLVDKAKTNVYAAGLLAGICNLAGHLRKSMLYTSRKMPMGPHHLFYAAPELDVWMPIFQQLALVFCGTIEAPYLPSCKPEKMLQEMTKLGRLPWLVNLAGLKTSTIAKCVDAAEISLVSCIDHSTAGALTEQINRSFVTIEDYSRQDISQIHMESLMELQEATPGFILEVLNLPEQKNEIFSYSNGQSLAVSGYELVCSVLNLASDDTMRNLVKTRYTPESFLGCRAFMNTLHLTISKRHNIRIVYETPTKETLSQGIHAFVMNELVLLSKDVVQIVNKNSRALGIFREPSLTMDFKKSNLLREIPTDLNASNRHFWALDRSTWNTYIMKETGLSIRPVWNTNVISLNEKVG